MMSSNGFPAFDGLTEQYDEDWLFGLEEDTLKCSSSPPPNAAADMALSVPVRTCPSPLSQIPTREPFPSEAPPKLSPVPCEQQTFITLSNHVPPPQGAASSQQLMQPTPSTSNTQPAELNPLEYELCGTEVTMVPVQSTSPVIIAKQAIDVHMVQPSTSGLQHNGTLVQQPAGCLQAVNGQWFVQAQVQHVQTSGGTVIAVVPNFCRTQGTPVAQATIATQSPQQIVASIGAQPTQHVMHSQTPQHQTVVHTSRASNTAVSVNVVSANTQQSHSVMQHLLSQPTLARQQASSSATMSNVITPKPKQRAPQSRANGRKKNAAQGGTLGAVLAKANKLAAASSTDASLNQILPPSQGIEMRLSVQNSEQVANLSKEISRLQNLQATYNVDHSAEIKDLENKRAQIFFEALAQQHKDKDLLSAVNAQPSVTVSTSSRQRNNYSRQHHPPQQRVVVQHQSQPSTSCEQPLVMYEAAPNPQAQESPLNYQPYQLSPYPSTSQATLQRNSYDPRVNQVQVAQAPVVQQYTYAANEPQVTPVCSSYIGEHAQTGVSQANVVLQAASPCTTNMQSVLVSGPTEAVVPPSPLYPPPDLPTSADIASAVSDKRQRRTQRLHDYFEQLRRLVQYADTTSPFRDLSDALNRLLPFHVYHEPELNNAIIDQFDDDCLRHFVHLTERKNRVEHRLRTILYNEAMRDADSSEQCLLLSMESEYEKRKLEEERSKAANDIEAFVSNSALCTELSEEQLQNAKKEFDSRKPASPLKQHIHFDYHPFSEEELLARCISPMPDSDLESSSSFEQEEESQNSDANEELCDVKQEQRAQEETSEIEAKLSDVKIVCSAIDERASGMADVSAQAVYTGVAMTARTGQRLAPSSNSSSSSHKGELRNDGDWIESSPSPELTPAVLGSAALPKIFPVMNENVNVTAKEDWIEQPTSCPAEQPASLLWRRSSSRSLSRRDSQVCSPNYAASSPVVRHASPAGSTALAQAGSQRPRGVVQHKQLPEPREELIRPQIRQDSRPFRKRKFPSAQPAHDSLPVTVEEGPSVNRSEEVQLRSRKCGTPSSQPREKREPPLLARKRQLQSSQTCDTALAASVRSSPISHDEVVRSSPIAFPGAASSSFSPAKVELSLPCSRDETQSPQTRQESNRTRLQNASPELPLRSLSTQIKSSERMVIHSDENSATIERQPHPTVAYHATVHVPLESAPNGVQKETPQSEGRIETRPPIKIKIALMDASLKKRDDGGDTKRRKERKKDKKRKHHTHHSHNENRENGCKLEANGLLASCSNEMRADNLSAQLVASTLDDPSHSRILMRISRKKNGSTPEPTCSALSGQLSGGERRVDAIVSEPVLPPRIPKLKIRIGRSDVNEEGRVTRVSRTDEGKESACELGEKHSSLAHQPKKSPSRSEDVPKLHASSCAPSDDVQFSPHSEASDEEADQQLRAQTDTVISQLSGWGPSLPLSHNPAETFSRLVGSSPLVNPLLGALMPLPSAPWLLNAANLNHAAAGIAAAQSLPWLIPPSALMQQAATAQPRKLSSAATAPLDNPR